MALTILALLPQAQAALLTDGTVRVVSDPCIDAGALFEDPMAIVTIASHCTVGDTKANVSVVETPEGTFRITIEISYAEHAYTFVIECSDPRRLPRLGDGGGTRYAPCWRPQEWLQID